MENKQKRITLKIVHEMLDDMSVELAEKVHLLFMAFSDFPRPLLAKRGSTSPCIPFDLRSTSVTTRQSKSEFSSVLAVP